MTELAAAVAREQLTKLDDILKQYQELAKQFDIPLRPGCTSAYYKFASQNMQKNPNEEIFHMKDHYITPAYKLPLFREKGYEQNICPVCEEVDSKIKLAWLKEVL
jgi:dTDP-4-amino-4,6-dideoxygalactose transaminase